MMARIRRAGPDGERLWRLRKLHSQIDATLVDRGDAGVEIAFFYNGERVYSRRWPAREPGVADAARTRADLERSGWTSHW
ncbi:MAG: hypothetical protein DMF91_05160 [Acidobacteria bacterium]|nr:MAG: hypothetical protein DMF91_05160 [Acidobacteriota bacterium]